MITRQQFSKHGGPVLDDCAMCETCRLAPWKPLTLSAAGSPANLFRLRVDGKYRVIRGGCGPNSPVWCLTYDPESFCWKTPPGCTPLAVPMSSLTLPRSATTRSGIVFLRRPSALGTSANDGSVLPTLVVRDKGTPNSAEHDARKKAEGHGQSSLITKLNQLLPTLTASDGDKTTVRTKYGQGGDAIPQSLATLTARDGKSCSRASSTPQKLSSQPLNEQLVNLAGSGVLNPVWAEWFMGFPLHWSDPKQSPIEVNELGGWAMQ